ncbi:Cation-transporting ATPase pacL (partial) [Bradyrhizobium sp. ORS 278]|uniref:hypothetical protein n=1 Tax=Bradyrhizobium sp. (strain ORS 278) TaxID=114615 RepID=UPI00015084F6|nr:hypothetical protein [Bradyrhizobium sp. ORS 278]CAL80037.1 Cation-transporting ATPase pacL (partial) [Bradyrhizobium sp. ORS 278]
MIFLLVLVIIAVVGGALVHADNWLDGLAMLIIVPLGIWGFLALLNYIFRLP